MIKMKMAYKAMQQELRQIQSRYPSLLNAKYLLEEIKLCERYLSDYPELADEQYKDIVATSPAALANSARLLLLNGRANEIKHRTLPLFADGRNQTLRPPPLQINRFRTKLKRVIYHLFAIENRLVNCMKSWWPR